MLCAGALEKPIEYELFMSYRQLLTTHSMSNGQGVRHMPALTLAQLIINYGLFDRLERDARFSIIYHHFYIDYLDVCNQ